MALPHEIFDLIITSNDALLAPHVHSTFDSIHMTSMKHHLIIRARLESKEPGKGHRKARKIKLLTERTPHVSTGSVVLKAIVSIAIKVKLANSVVLLKASSRRPSIEEGAQDSSTHARRDTILDTINYI